MFRSILAFSQLLEMMLQVAQGVSYAWRGICRQQHLSWSRVIRGSEFISRRQPEGSCPLRISKALVVRSNSAIRATGAEHSCHDLAKQLSHYLYFLFFSFLFFYLRLTTQKRVCHSCAMDQQSHTVWFTTTPKGRRQQGYLLTRVQLFMQFI